MELNEAINKRKSIRSFTNKSVTKKEILEIIEAGTLAPSAKNRQPWYFIVLNENLKNKIVDFMLEYTKNEDKEDHIKKLGTKSSVESTRKIINSAPVLILIFKTKNRMWETGDTLSLGACIENMCLKGTDLGLGTLWVRDTVYIKRKVENLFKLKDLEFNSSLVVGHTKYYPVHRKRKKLDDVILWK